jgi:4-diphosphocytidyl-2-C-methyl-D-erythritol kinase
VSITGEKFMAVSVFSPAKLNLFLAVTGRRADGFHDLVSVAAPLDFGDALQAEAASGFSLACDDPAVPVDGTNLVLRAAQAFAAATGWRGGATFRLTKRIPIGAGLGGGSSNAVAALRVLNELSGKALADSGLFAVAAELGSDCALFLHQAPVIMRGRGEQIETLPAVAMDRVRGRRVLVFKPSFGISTPWAYGRMAAAASAGTSGPAPEAPVYMALPEAEDRLAAWVRSDAPAEELLANNMESVAFEKYLALPVLLALLRRDFGVTAHMSGSGSACFALLKEDFAAAPMIAAIRAAWGPGAFVQEARLV